MNGERTWVKEGRKGGEGEKMRERKTDRKKEKKDR